MKKLCAVTLCALLALTIAPAMSKTSASSSKMPACKGRVVMVDATGGVYSTNTKWSVPRHKMLVMCEASAKAKGYHLMSNSPMSAKPKSKLVGPGAHPKATIAPVAAVTAPPVAVAAAAIDVAASNWKFSPSAITLHAGQTTQLHLTSTSGVHGIKSDELGIPLTTIMPGKTVTVSVTPKKAGTYVLHCAIMCGAGHANMVLTVVVEPQ